MKQYLVIFGCLLAGLGGYKLFMEGDDTDPQRRALDRRGGRGNISAPQDQRPNLGEGGGRQGRNNAGGGVRPPQLPPTVLGAEASWDGTTTEDTLVRIEDAWSIDLSGVDWDAPVLIRVGGVDITQADFQRQVVLRRGLPVLRAALFAHMGRSMATRYGHEFGIDDELWSQYVELWGADRGLDRDGVLAEWARSLNVPVALAERARRDFLEGILACYAPAETVEQLPSEVLDMIADTGALANIFQLQALLTGLREEGADSVTSEGISAARQLVGLDLPLTMMMQGVGDNELFRRSWTSMDREMPDGMVAALYGGELPVAEIRTPWDYAGEVAYVPQAEIYASLRESLRPDQLEEDLLQEIWGKVLSSELQALGKFPPPDEVWRNYAREYMEGQMAALGTAFMRTAAEGFLSMPHYRRATAILAAFKANQPLGWDTDQEMRAFFTDHRFFVQGWQPDLELALFPAASLEPERLGQPDWERSLAEAQAFHARVTEGGEDFRQVLGEHNAALTESYRAVLGDAGAEAFANDMAGGRFMLPRVQVERVLKETRAVQMLSATSLVRNAVVRLKKGDVSPPWPSRLGYVVVRLNNARLGGLEDVYDDLEDATRTEFYETYFKLWVNETLSGSEVVIP